MKIQDKDRFHGSALAQIIEHPHFKTIKRGSEKYGHYRANENRDLFFKYRKTKTSPWTFQFSPEDVSELYHAMRTRDCVFLCLICGTTTICALNTAEVCMIIDLSKNDSSQSISIQVPDGGRCHVSGSEGKLSHTIPHNSFPDKILAEE